MNINGIKLIVSDFDGTLADTVAGKPVPQRNVEALRAARRRGVSLCLASGRTYHSLAPYMAMFDADCPSICCNGAQIRDDSKVYFNNPFSKELLPVAAAFAKKAGVGYLALTDTHGFWGGDVKIRLTGFADERDRLKTAEDLARMRERDVFKVSFIARDDRALDELRPMIEEAVNGFFPDECEYGRTFWNVISITPRGVNKGSALKFLANELSIPTASIMAIGDNENDIPMLVCSGLGVAVGSGVDKIKLAADYVAPPVDDAGAAEAIERFVLNV